jgi:cytochrome c peroxidase
MLGYRLDWLRVARVWATCAWLAAGCGGDEADAPSGHDHSTHSHGDPDAGVRANDAGTPPPDGSIIGRFSWKLPPGFPRPKVPLDNPMSDEKVELGRHLFYDKRLSGNQTQSCATCHKQERAFADERAVGLGSTGELHTRGAMSLANVGYTSTLTWANPPMVALERQAQVPIFGDAPIELGMHSIADLEARLRTVPEYAPMFAAAYPGNLQPITMLHVQQAIGAFQRTLISGDSPYDRYLHGDLNALGESAKRGMRFVTTNEDHRFECNHCHGGFAFSDHTVYEGLADFGARPPFHQTGLYDLDGHGGYPAPNRGAYEISQRPEDMGMFKAPTLRNIALTAPYMHDGSLQTLSDVIDHYAKGGRARNFARTDPLIQPFTITDQEKADIIAFLEALTDQTFLTDPRFADPWPK